MEKRLEKRIRRLLKTLPEGVREVVRDALNFLPSKLAESCMKNNYFITKMAIQRGDKIRNFVLIDSETALVKDYSLYEEKSVHLLEIFLTKKGWVFAGEKNPFSLEVSPLGYIEGWKMGLGWEDYSKTFTNI